MNKSRLLINILLSLTLGMMSSVIAQESPSDTSYNTTATPKILNMLKPGKAPFLTIQMNLAYNSGLFDLAANDNTAFSKSDFIGGRNFGTRHGIGGQLIAKLRLHKEGNARLLVVGGFNFFSSSLIISETSEGLVRYNVFSGGLGLENNFSPQKKFKPYISFEILANFISGKADLKSDTGTTKLTIKNAIRIGGAVGVGFEYALDNSYGINLGIKLTHANVLLRESKESANANEIYLNDDKITTPIPYAGWKQFVYMSFHTGFNFYFGGKFKK